MILKSWPYAATLALLAGCSSQTPQERRSDDARDVAMVERMSRAPLVPVTPSAISRDDIARYGLDRPGCIFTKASGEGPLFIATRDDGFMRLGSEIKRFAAKQTGAGLPGGARTTYVGLSSSVDFARQPSDGTADDQADWPARMIVHDAQDRVAFMADGRMRCSA